MKDLNSFLIFILIVVINITGSIKYEDRFSKYQWLPFCWIFNTPLSPFFIRLCRILLFFPSMVLVVIGVIEWLFIGVNHGPKILEWCVNGWWE